MNSQEIAELIAQQNQFFMGQNAMATSIGVSPQMYGGMSQFGMFPRPLGGVPVMPQAPGGPSMPGAFNYGNNPFAGYGAGNRIGAGAMSTIAAAPGLAQMGLGIAATQMPFLAPFTNPISGFGVGRALGMGMMGSGAVAGAFMLPAMAMQHIAGSAVQGAQQQSMVNTALSPYQHFNAQSRTGFGFSREDTQAIGSQMRQMAYIPELLTSMEELTKILPKIRASGAMQGMRDASEFNRRFKETVNTVRDVSRMLGTTLDEAADFFSHSRSVGFLGRNDQIRNAVNARVTGALTGMGQDTFMALQRQGADLATAVGANRAIGARAATAMADQIGLAQQSGLIQQGLVEDVTGKQGEAAVADMSMRMATAGVRYAGQAQGRYIIAGAVKTDAQGRVIGLDKDIMKKVASGEISSDQLRALGSSKMANQRTVLSFTSQQAKLGMQFAEQGGGAAMYGFALKLMGGDEDKARILLSQHWGVMGEAETDVAKGMFQLQQSGLGTQADTIRTVRAQQAALGDRSPQAIIGRLTRRIGASITQPFQQWGAEMSTKISRSVDEVLDEVTGNIFIAASEEGRKAFSQAMATGDMKTFLAGAKGTNFAASGGASKKWYSGLVGGPSAPSQFESAVRAIGGYRDTGNARNPSITSYDMNNMADQERVQRDLKGLNEGRLWAGSNFSVKDLSETQQQGLREMGDRYVRMLSQEKGFAQLGYGEQIDKLMAWVRSNAGANPLMGNVLTQFEEEAGNKARDSGSWKSAPDMLRTAIGSGVRQAAKAFNPALARRVEDLYSGAFGTFDITKVRDQMNSASKALESLLGQHAPDFAKSSKMRKALSMVINDPTALGLAATGQTSEFNKITGLKLTSEEQSKLAEVAQKLSYDEKQKVGGVMQRYDSAQDSTTVLAFSQALTNSGTEISEGAEGVRGAGRELVEKIGAGFGALSSAITLGDEKERATKAGEVRGSLSTDLSSLYKLVKSKQLDPSTLPAPLRAAIARMQSVDEVSRDQKLQKNITIDELSAQTHLSGDTLRKVLAGGANVSSVYMDQGKWDKVRGTAGMGAIASNAEERSTRIHQAAKDEQMIATMKGIAEAMLIVAKDPQAAASRAERAMQVLGNVLQTGAPTNYVTLPGG